MVKPFLIFLPPIFLPGVFEVSKKKTLPVKVKRAPVKKPTPKPRPAAHRQKPKAPRTKNQAPSSPAERYAAGVLSGKIPAGDKIRLAVERHARDLKDGHKRGLVFDQVAAERVIRFFSLLHHSKGEWAGKPFVPLDWQQFLLSVLFGWKRKIDGLRRFRRAYIEIPKKNGKSTICSGISLYLLVADAEAGAEIYNAAADRDQASIVYSEAANMAEASPALNSRLEVVRSTKRIVFPATRSVYKALSAEVNTKEGINWHGLIFDELHAQKTRDMFDTLTYGGAARRQPLFAAITTAGYDRESICYEQRDYAVQILEQRIEDDSFFGFIACAEETEDWKDPVVWRRANPSYGITIKEDAFENDAKEAQASPAKENSFRRYRLNQWTEQDVRAIPMDQWDAGARQVSAESLFGHSAHAGLDLGSTSDLTALGLIFEFEGLPLLKPYFWVPAASLHKKENRMRSVYQTWAKQGFLKVTEGNTTDYDVVRRDLNELAALFAIREIAVDRLFQGAQLCTQLMQDGFDVIAFGQGFASMAAPTKEFLERLANGTLLHDGSPVLGWMAGNLAIEQDAAGNQKPTKKKSGGKIDGIVSSIMGLGRRAVSAGDSVYDNRGCDSF